MTGFDVGVRLLTAVGEAVCCCSRLVADETELFSVQQRMREYCVHSGPGSWASAPSSIRCLCHVNSRTISSDFPSPETYHTLHSGNNCASKFFVGNESEAPHCWQEAHSHQARAWVTVEVRQQVFVTGRKKTNGPCSLACASGTTYMRTSPTAAGLVKTRRITAGVPR